MTGETVLLSVAMDVAAGLVGSFAVMRHMSLAADPRSHIALPGIGLALALHAQPIFGAVVALLVGAVCWSGPSRREHRQQRRPSSESSFPPRSRLEALRPGARTSSMRSSEIRRAQCVRNRLCFAGSGWHRPVHCHKTKQSDRYARSPDLARTAGVNVLRLELMYMLVFALTIALGLRYLGVLLMGALIIVPAVTAKRLARNLNETLIDSGAIRGTVDNAWQRHRFLAQSGNWPAHCPGCVRWIRD